MNAPRFEARDVWRDDGHLSDLVLTALADGQDSLVPEQARAHVATCEACGRRLGEVALRALEIGEGLASEAALPLGSSELQPGFRLPAVAFSAAFLLALLGSVPRLLELWATLDATTGSWVETGLVAVKGAVVLFRSASQQDTLAVTLAWGAAALVVLALGAMVARLTPPETLERTHHGSHDS